MHFRYLTMALACALVAKLAHAQPGNAASALSEQDFLTDVPIVLSVSRLAQRLDDTPGAMTILDRDFIRMTGARDVVDVLRFVPGFQTTSTFETDAPMATYHGRTEDFANRVQVMVDGRSVYSGFLQGSAGSGWQTLALEDIERIEVLRGSNSASYGARAFLGVVNIVSRDVRETQGSRGWVRGGENGLGDVGASLGWGANGTQSRLSVDTRGDMGLRKSFTNPARESSGLNQISRINFSTRIGDMGPGEWNLRLGGMEVAAKRGRIDDPDYGNIERLRFLGAQYLQLDWAKTLSADEDLQVSASRTSGFSNDAFPYLNPSAGVYYGAEIAFKAQETNDVLGVQYNRRISPSFQLVTGAEFRSEVISSSSSFDTRKELGTHFSRLYSNMEWRVVPAVVLNVGALAEDSDIAGRNFAPRAMLNWHVLPDHTLRVGYSSAFRTPSAFEKYGEVTYHDSNGGNPLPYLRASGNVSAEYVDVREWGYMVSPGKAGVSMDLRVFQEQVRHGIGRLLPGPGPQGDFANGDDFRVEGVEWQWGWQPSSAARLHWSQAWTNVTSQSMAFPSDLWTPNAKFKIEHSAPVYQQSLVGTYKFPQGYSVSLMHQYARDFAVGGDNDRVYSVTRNDVRLAHAFSLGRRARAELALLVQGIGRPQQDFDKDYWFDQRTWLSLLLEY